MIKKVVLKNFKIHQHSEIYFEEMLSILTGENNSGKTSLLESLLIFQECYNHTLHQIKSSSSSKVKSEVLEKGDYDFQPKFIGSFSSVRSESYYELFYKNSKTFEILIEVVLNDKTIKIGFVIAKGRNATAYNIMPSIDDESLQNINSFNPQRLLMFLKSSPISSIVRNEPYLAPKMLEKYLIEGSNLSIMRNRLLKIQQEDKLRELESQIKYILNFESFELEIDYNRNQDLYIKANFKTDSMDEFQDIAMLGSGTLQIIEVLISLNLEDSYKLRIALLDEPDSHLHRKLQGQLLTKLREISHNAIQIILTTHNEQIVSHANLSEILHLYIPQTSSSMVVKPFVNGYQRGRTTGFIQNAQKQALYSSLGISTTAMNMLEAVESDRVVLVEGGSDALYIEALQERRSKLFPVGKSNQVAFWSINGIDDLPNKLKYWKSILENIVNEESIWSKAVLLLDSDTLADSEMQELAKEIKKEFSIELIYWKSYTIETVLLERVEGFAYTFATLFGLDRDRVVQKVQEYIGSIEIENYKHKISKQRQSRQKHFECFNNPKLKLNDGHIYSEYITMLQGASSVANYLYGKKEVFDLIVYLLEVFSIQTTQPIEDILVEMFLAYDGNYWQSSWTQILRGIYDK